MTKWVGHRKDKSEICEKLAASTWGFFRIDGLAVCFDYLKLNGLGGGFWSVDVEAGHFDVGFRIRCLAI